MNAIDLNRRADDRSEFNWQGLIENRYDVVVFDWDGTCSWWAWPRSSHLPIRPNLAGVYSQKMVKFPYSELQFKADDRMNHAYTEIVPFPFPFGFKLKIDGLDVKVEDLEHLREYRRKLDIMHGNHFRITRSDSLSTA